MLETYNYIMDVLLHNLSVCEYKTYSKRYIYIYIYIYIYADTGTRTNVVCFRRVLPARVNALDYLRVR